MLPINLSCSPHNEQVKLICILTFHKRYSLNGEILLYGGGGAGGGVHRKIV